MKKLLCVLMSILIVLSLVACSNSKDDDMQYADELIEKYKRSDINELKENPEYFIDNVVGIFLNAKSNKFENGWWKDEEKNGSYRVETVAFDVPTIIINGSIDIESEYADNLIAFMFSVNERQDIAESICKFAFEKYGDAYAILDGKDSEISEFELRTNWENAEYEYSVLWVTSYADIMVGYGSQYVAIIVAENIDWAK